MSKTWYGADYQHIIKFKRKSTAEKEEVWFQTETDKRLMKSERAHYTFHFPSHCYLYFTYFPFCFNFITLSVVNHKTHFDNVCVHSTCWLFLSFWVFQQIGNKVKRKLKTQLGRTTVLPVSCDYWAIEVRYKPTCEGALPTTSNRYPSISTRPVLHNRLIVGLRVILCGHSTSTVPGSSHNRNSVFAHWKCSVI